MNGLAQTFLSPRPGTACRQGSDHVLVTASGAVTGDRRIPQLPTPNLVYRELASRITVDFCITCLLTSCHAGLRSPCGLSLPSSHWTKMNPCSSWSTAAREKAPGPPRPTRQYPPAASQVACLAHPGLELPPATPLRVPVITYSQ